MTTPQQNSVSVNQLKQLLDHDRNILVLDVRTKDEYVGPLGHVHNAKNIELAELPYRLSELQAHLALPIAVVCRTDRRASMAVEKLQAAGFKKPVVVMGGMEQWNKEGLPVER